MADKDTFSNSLNFSIESTNEISGDELFNSMEDTITGDPNDVKKIDVTDKKDKKDKKKKTEEEEEEEDDDDKKTSKKKEEPVGGRENDKLLDLLSDEEDEEEDALKEDKKSIKKEEAKIAKTSEVEDDQDEDSDEDDDSNSFPSLTKELYKLGIFTVAADEEEEEVSTGKELRDLFIKEQKKGAVNILEGILARHGEDKREMFDAVILKGVDPKEYLQRYIEIEDLKGVDLANPEVQERVVREELKAQGWEKVDIDEEVERVKSYGDLESSSKRYHKSLVKRNENKIIEEKRKKESQEEEEVSRDNEYRTNITAILNAKLKDKDFDGIPVTPELAAKTLDSIYTKKWRLPSGETITDFDNRILRLKRPENHALKVKIGLLLELLETDPTLSSIKKKAISNESGEIFKDLEKKKLKKQSSTKRERPSEISSWFSS